MQPDRLGSLGVHVEVAAHGIADHRAQLLEVVGFGHDRSADRARDVPAFRDFLDDQQELGHGASGRVPYARTIQGELTAQWPHWMCAVRRTILDGMPSALRSADTSDAAAEMQRARWRAMSPRERLIQVCASTRAVLRLEREGIRLREPMLGEGDAFRRMAGRRLGETLATRVYGPLHGGR